MAEQTLIFIKPDGVKRGLVGPILSRFEKRGITINRLEMKTLSSELCDAHYQEHLERPFYPDLKSYILSGPIVIAVLEADNVVSMVRKMVGVTNSAEAEPGTIRGDFATTLSFNVIHASDSPESSAREIANFFG